MAGIPAEKGEVRTKTEGRVSPLPGREKHRNVARYEVGRDHSIRLAFIVRATRSHLRTVISTL